MFVTIIVPVHLKTLLSKLLSVKSYQQKKIKKRATAHFCVVAFLNATRTIAERVGIDITEDMSYNESVAKLNPFQYRGYYYDAETGLYYLNSRYYDPSIGRFINADDISYIQPEQINGLNLFAYCGNNPVMHTDNEGNMPNWLKVLLGAVVIVGLGIATALTGGTAGVILGAAFWGATTGAIGGGLISGTIGAITGGAQGFLDGFVDGFMWGAVIGGITGALTSGINIATGAVKIVGSAQKTGTFFHRMASNIQAGKMAIQIGRYSQITLDRSLNRAGLIGRKMPDVIGTARWGKNLLVEVTSKSQTNLQMANKLVKLLASNPNTTYKVIGWAARIAKWLF